MKGFVASVPGRWLFASFGLALFGGGLAAILTNPAALYVMAVSILVAIALTIVSLPQAVEDYPFETTLGAIVLPVALFLYACALGVVMTYAPQLGYVLMIAGLGSAGFALRPARAAREAPAKRARPLEAATAHR